MREYEGRQESEVSASAHGGAPYTSTPRARKALAAAALLLACSSESAPAPSASVAAVPTPSLSARDALASSEPRALPVWRSTGFGVAEKATGDAGGVVFVGLSGWKITLEPTEVWVDALDSSVLRASGARWIYAVQGPKDVFYKAKEIDLAALAASIGAHRPERVILAAHSSGAYVAHALLELLPEGPKVAYFNLDGGVEGFTKKARARADRLVFVAATDRTVRTSTPHKAKMKEAATKFRGEFLDVDATGSGCRKGATWCMHMTLITTKPHDPKKAGGEIDYTDWADIAPATAWFTP